MGYLLFDDENRVNLLPLAYTKPVAEFRIGILTIAEKWRKMMPDDILFSGYKTVDYLQDKYSCDTREDTIWINGSVCPNDQLVQEVLQLKNKQCLLDEAGNVIAFRAQEYQEVSSCENLVSNIVYTHIKNLWNIF